jgi:hypothetical protein
MNIAQAETGAESVVTRAHACHEDSAERAGDASQAARDAVHIDDVLDQLTFLTAEQKTRADSLVADGNFRALGHLICACHEQLAQARVSGSHLTTVLWDELPARRAA